MIVAMRVQEHGGLDEPGRVEMARAPFTSLRALR